MNTGESLIAGLEEKDWAQSLDMSELIDKKVLDGMQHIWSRNFKTKNVKVHDARVNMFFR